MQEKNCYHTNNVTLCKDNILHTVDSLRLMGANFRGLLKIYSVWLECHFLYSLIPTKIWL